MTNKNNKVMKAEDYSIMYCKDGNLYINNNRWTEFRSDDCKLFSEEDLESIERWVEQNNKYIRKDAFIEKVLDYIENNIYDHYDGDHEYGICGGYVKKEDFIKYFKKYMEGE